jgi:branched-chain amino acid transport system permease protein
MTDLALPGLAKARVRLGAFAAPVLGRGLLLAAGVWLVISFLAGPQQFISAALIGLNNGTVYALIALGYTLVYGIIELINFAHGDLFMLGTLFSATVISRWFGQGKADLAGWLTVLLAFVGAMIFCATINVAIEFLAYRRLRHAPKLAPLITAVGFSFILQNIGQKWNGSGQKNWDTVFPSKLLQVGSVEIPPSLILVMGVTAPLLVLLTFVVTKTRQGKAMRATAQDLDAARLMGIDVNRTISFTFALGGALAGAAGVMFQQSYGYTRFDLGFQLGLIAFTAAVLGGIGNLSGAVLGGILIGVIQGVNEGAPHGLGSKWSETVVFSILILLLVFKPEGLLGKPTVEKV